MFWEDVFKLVLAMILGGLVGLEREITNRPAGFRTHTLVCMGSTLVMVTSMHLFRLYHDIVNLDPARLGAQVISGIGFLGAGTILKDKARVRGLTTAASLWVVACIGLAVGAGLYGVSIFVAVLAYVTLILLKKMERFLKQRLEIEEIELDIRNVPGQIAKVTECMGRLNVQIRDIKIEPTDEPWVQTKFYVMLPRGMKREELMEELKTVEGVEIYTEED
ncbi:MgtC/SapB family protein [Caldicoprobacter faecalis]|uniref:Putative Mg2+ transporter-C (MgtC) family protein n=1 Tax=Caldicoprobacter faecalis TaxID=937334 RepID=A0A1I5TFR0_9FIRM|nr:MgtC/SapB family protein [Caldicoprobacter faecalis]SFP81890.1 putative Mg2+ transporter-C (MgtC) family protein [Caldicoprobacter faecalis]